MFFKKLTKRFFIFILTSITLAFFYILSPYFSVILWATVLAIIFNPIKNRLCIILGNRNKLASLLTIAIICLIVFIPLIIVFSLLMIELNTIYNKLIQDNDQFSKIITDFISYLPDWINNILEDHNLINIMQIQKKLSNLILEGSQSLASSAFLICNGTFSFVVNFSIMLYLLFFLLKDGHSLINHILGFIPLSNYMKYHLFTKFISVTRVTIRSTIVTAVTHGVLGCIVFYIADIDNSIFWGTLITFLSLIPILGSAIIWVPTAIYFFITHQLWQCCFIIIFFLIIIGIIDNILRPLLVGRDIKMPDYLILIATLGGIDVYGINGIINGPLIAAMFISCWNLFSWKDYINGTNKYNRTFIKRKIHSH